MSFPLTGSLTRRPRGKVVIYPPRCPLVFYPPAAVRQSSDDHRVSSEINRRESERERERES